MSRPPSLPTFLFSIITDSLSSKVRTPDMGGESTTHGFTKAVLDKMETV